MHLFNVHCMMCGRAAGYVSQGTFQKLPSAPALVKRQGRSLCGFCGGNIYLEAEDSPVVPRPIAPFGDMRASDFVQDRPAARAS